MLEENHRIHRRLPCLFLGLGAVAPLDTFAAGSTPPSYFSHLGSDTLIIAILASNIVLLLGFLLHVQQMRRALAKKNAALEKNERRIRLMGDNLPNTTVFQLECSPCGEFAFRYLSKGYEHALGMGRDRVMQDATPVFDHLYENDIPSLQEAYRSAKETLAPTDLGIRMLDISGNLKWLHIKAVPHREQNTLVWDGVVQDISDSRRIETALVDEKRNFKNLFETMDDLLLVCDMNGKLLHTNPSVEQRLNYSSDELGDMSLFDLYPEHFRDEAYQMIALMQTEQTFSCGLPLQTKRGETIPVEINMFHGSWENKQAIFGVARDISNRQQTENALRESQQMLRLIMDTIPLSVFWKDKDSVYLGCNKAFLKECNLPSIDNVIGKTPFDLFDTAVASGLIVRDQQVITTNQPLFNVLYSHPRRDGSMGWRETSEIPLHDADNRAIGVLGVWRDVTEENRAEDRLKRTLEDMERFNQLMRGRELRTLELKGEINHLLKELGQPIKYRTTKDDLA